VAFQAKVEYDTNSIDLRTLVKNLKTNTIELKEKLFADKPIRKQKEVPIENQHALSSTFQTHRGSILRNELETEFELEAERPQAIQKQQQSRKEEDFLFGSISAAKH